MTETLAQPNANGLCECGCGQSTPLAPQSDTKLGRVKGQPIRFINGHQSRGPRERGYRVHGGAPLHVAIASKALGRPLPKRAEVHHVDGDSLNNTPTNLVICENRAYHMLLHVRTRIVKAGGNPNTQKICSGCQGVFDLESFTLRRGHKSHGRGQNCPDCRKAFNRAYKRPVERMAS